MSVTIYSTEYCPFCVAAKNLLDSLQIDSDANTSEINTHKGIRGGLEDELSFIEGEVGGAKQMAEDYKIRYTQQYLLNWSMFIGIVLSSATLFYTFRNVECVYTSY